VAGLRRNQWPIPIGIRKRKRRVVLRAALEEIATQTKNSKARGFEASTILLNIALFLLIAERDIQAAKIDALTHPDQWHRSLNARIILLTVHGRDLDLALLGGDASSQASITLRPAAPSDATSPQYSRTSSRSNRSLPIANRARPGESSTICTTRSRTSGEYRFSVFMLQSSQRLEPPGNPGRFKELKKGASLSSSIFPCQRRFESPQIAG
jgi:hypothetical protein